MVSDPDSPSTSYKSRLDTPAEEDQLQTLTLVNPCYGAPAPTVELQPFSSRQSRQGYSTNEEGKGRVGEWPVISEGTRWADEGEKAVGQDDHDVNGQDASLRVMSKPRMILIASGMLLTYFLGVSSRPKPSIYYL